MGKTSDRLNYFPTTSKIVLDSNQQSQLFCKFEQFIPNVAQDLEITSEVAYDKALAFFSNKTVVVEPRGIQGKIYKIMQSVQNYIPMAYVTEAVSVMKTTGFTDLIGVRQAPLTFVGATYIGGLFFSYCVSIAGNNPVGIVFNSTSFLLSRLMRGVDIILNGLILRTSSNVVSLPLILNGTQQMLNGKGLSIQEYTKIGLEFEQVTNSTIVKKTKKIYKIIRNT